jgi:hypothetical protein
VPETDYIGLDEAVARGLAIHEVDEAGAVELYVDHRSSLDEYLQALPRLDGQAGVLVGIVGRLVCLDYVSRSEVFAGLHLKLLRGYALEAIETPVAKPLRKTAVGPLPRGARARPAHPQAARVVLGE